MEELDYLKKDWEEKTAFPKVEKNEVLNMLRKNSTSILGWIITLCCLEFLFYIAINIILPHRQFDLLFFEILYWVLKIGSYVVAIGFIYLFVRLQRKIQVNKSIAALMESILKVRKNMYRYINFNINYLSILMFLLWMNDVASNNIKYFQKDYGFIYSGAILLALLFVLCIGAVFYWIQTTIVGFIMNKFYNIVYGKLITRLTTNYTELIKSDSD